MFFGTLLASFVGILLHLPTGVESRSMGFTQGTSWKVCNGEDFDLFIGASGDIGEDAEEHVSRGWKLIPKASCRQVHDLYFTGSKVECEVLASGRKDCSARVRLSTVG